MTEISGANRKPVVLLTGCVNPSGMTFTKLQNPEIRKRQYIDAIKFFLNHTDNLVVFVENSGVDLSNDFKGASHQDRLELITFYGNDFNKALGKGYGEMIILKYAFENSDFIKKNSSVLKITGRYMLLNIKPILKSYDKYVCNVMVNLPRQLKYADSRIFIAEKSFFIKYLFPTAEMINDDAGYYFEHALNRAVLTSILEEKYQYLPFKYHPRLKGISGTDSLVYDTSFYHWFIENIKNIIQFNLFKREWDIRYSYK